MVKIKLEGIEKIFGKKSNPFYALKDISFEIKSSSFFGILGASGAGKTTLMRIIAGLETPSAGKVYFDNRIVSADGKDIVPVEERNVGMVFQNWALYPHLSNYENIAFPLKVLHWSSADIRARIVELSDILGIKEILDKRPGQTSGGQQQRVALARALSKNPSLLLLDEPFSNLDANTKNDARSLVINIQKKLGVTTVIVSHDPSDIFTLAEEVAVISSGKLIQTATPSDLYDRPLNIKVATTLGEMNLINGYIELKSGIMNLELTGISKIILKSDYGKEQSKAVKIGIRPEDLALTTEGKDLKATEEADTSSKGEWIKLGELKTDVSNYSQGSFLVSTIYGVNKSRLNIISREAIPSGKSVTIYARRDRIKIFDGETGDYIPILEKALLA